MSPYTPRVSEDRALAAADALGLTYEVTRHGPVRSLEEAAAARGLAPAQVIKTLVVRLAEDDHRFVLVPGGREISWPRAGAPRGPHPSREPEVSQPAVRGFTERSLRWISQCTCEPVELPVDPM